jgi:hypothetical protein
MTKLIPSPPGPADLPPFETRVVTENVVGTQAEISASISSTVENPVSGDNNTANLSLTEDPYFNEPEGAEENVESFAGMLDDFYSGETLSISSELDVAFEMDEVEIQEEEPWDDNDSDSDDDVDSGISEDERE